MKTKDEIWEWLSPVLVGPWSWSDLVGHIAMCIAYGIVRRPERNPEELVDEILLLLRRRALYIATGVDPSTTTAP